jgi:tetratricopeptide (TPR) repeat protein
METTSEKILPTFVLSAAKALSDGKSDIAIELCKNGIENFPEYPIGFILLAEAYEHSGDLDSVQIILSGASDLFPTNKTVLSVKKRFAQTGKLGYIIPNPIQTSIPDNIFNKLRNSISATGFVKPNPSDLPEEIEDLTQQNPEVPASETLAKILAGQGKIVEAIDMYKRLAESHPSKADYYFNEIEALIAE